MLSIYLCLALMSRLTSTTGVANLMIDCSKHAARFLWFVWFVWAPSLYCKFSTLPLANMDMQNP